MITVIDPDPVKKNGSDRIHNPGSEAFQKNNDKFSPNGESFETLCAVIAVRAHEQVVGVTLKSR